MIDLTFQTPKGTLLPLRDLRGNAYLDVKWRIVWFQEERPGWSIETEFPVLRDDVAVAKAVIRDDKGRVMSTGHKREDKNDFYDFSEKAETGAIGRALALIGFGTQFVSDEFAEGERIVDSPREARPTPTKPALVKPEGSSNSDLGAFPFTFGKYRGKCLDQIEIYALNSYCEWLKKSEKPSDEGKLAVKAIEAFLKTREVPRAK